MKKILLSSALAVICGSFALADDTTVATLFEGSQNVTWENTLMIPAEKFAGVSVGDYIYITFSETSDVIELKSDGTWLPGSRYQWLGAGIPEYKSYITADGLEALKENGLELCGASFTVTGVSVMNDGFVMPEGAIWGGYFWIDNWNTLEIWKTAFAKYDGEKYMVINISDDNGDNTNYVMQVMTAFDDDNAVIANASKGNETKTATMTVIDLSDVDLSEMIANVDKVFFQANPEGGNAFNITSIVITDTDPLETETPPTGAIESINVNNSLVDVYNVHGVLLKSKVNEKDVINDLPKGIYVVKGANSSFKLVK